MLIDDYLNYDSEYKKLYNKSLVLMQVGSFYELYSLNKDEIDRVCNLLEIQSTKKNKNKPDVDKNNPYMAGVPLYVIDKYINILTDNGYTIILVEQVTIPPNPKREITKIISPGTNIENNDIYNNFLMCVYFTIGNNKFITCSLSYIDVNTNKSYIYETIESDTDLNLEDIYKIILSNKPSEIVFFTDIYLKKNLELMDKLKKFTNIFSSDICIHNKIDQMINANFFKLSYQKTVLEKVFKNIGLLSVIEYLDLEMKPLSTISYTYLLQFCYEHSEKILDGLFKPVDLENNKYLCLVNNVLDNLNIISDKDSNKTSSILNLLNNCKTYMGKRYFKQCLLNPLVDIEKIKKRYDMCDYFIKDDLYQKSQLCLGRICDLEKLFKKIILSTLNPCQILSIYKSLHSTKELQHIISNNNQEFDKINCDKLNEFIDYLKNNFNFEETEKSSLLNQLSKNIFNKGVYMDMDDIEEKILFLENIFENVVLCLNENNENNTEFKLEINKDKVRSILVTKNRYENMLKDKKRYASIDNLLKQRCNLSLNDISFKPFSSTNKTTYKIIFKNMGENQNKLTDLQDELKMKVKDAYINTLKYIYNNFGDIFEKITEFVSNIDFFSCNAKNAVDNCYIRPNIVKNEDLESYIIAKSLRHPLIEKINVDIPYVSNDIEIGTENTKGMLLYGINSVGKTALMKSIGVNLIMAQAGLYVASKYFEFCPYNKVFTRIPGGDNIFKGQSTFIVEINELRTILKRSDNRSLVIGDELCSGTENISAVSLIASGINYLSNKKSSFIFATHIHELCDLDCVKNLKNIKIKHISVHFDQEKNCLIFDRILKDGNGNILYGLEIAQSLDLPSDFLYFANQIRQEYTNTKKNIIEPKMSSYNSLVFMDTCYICKKECNEVHHISEQQLANSKGIIEDKQINKNIKYNLLTVCNICHDNIHSNNIKIDGYIQTNKGIQLRFEKKDENDNSLKIENKIKEYRNKGMSYSKILENIKSEFEDQKITLYQIKKILKI